MVEFVFVAKMLNGFSCSCFRRLCQNRRDLVLDVQTQRRYLATGTVDVSRTTSVLPRPNLQ